MKSRVNIAKLELFFGGEERNYLGKNWVISFNPRGQRLCITLSIIFSTVMKLFNYSKNWLLCHTSRTCNFTQYGGTKR